MRLELSQDTFFAADRLIEQQRRDEALNLSETRAVRSACSRKISRVLLEHPTFRGNIAMMRCREGEIVDARNAAIVQDQHVAWFIAQQTPGEPQLTISATTASQMATRLSQWYDELSAIR